MKYDRIVQAIIIVIAANSVTRIRKDILPTFFTQQVPSSSDGFNIVFSGGIL